MCADALPRVCTGNARPKGKQLMSGNRATFRVGDRVELLLHYSLDNEPPPHGTVVSVGRKCVKCHMDRSPHKLSTLHPSDLRIIGKGKRGV
jgi:hypothetical protein